MTVRNDARTLWLTIGRLESPVFVRLSNGRDVAISGVHEDRDDVIVEVED